MKHRDLDRGKVGEEWHGLLFVNDHQFRHPAVAWKNRSAIGQIACWYRRCGSAVQTLVRARPEAVETRSTRGVEIDDDAITDLNAVRLRADRLDDANAAVTDNDGLIRRCSRYQDLVDTAVTGLRRFRANENLSRGERAGPDLLHRWEVVVELQKGPKCASRLSVRENGRRLRGSATATKQGGCPASDYGRSSAF